METAEELSNVVSNEFAAAVYIYTSNGVIQLDDELRAALDNALRPVLKRRLNAILAGTNRKEST